MEHVKALYGKRLGTFFMYQGAALSSRLCLDYTGKVCFILHGRDTQTKGDTSTRRGPVGIDITRFTIALYIDTAPV